MGSEFRIVAMGWSEFRIVAMGWHELNTRGSVDEADACRDLTPDPTLFNSKS